MEILTNYPWKGNIRELANFIERAVILTPGEDWRSRWPPSTSSDVVVAISSPSSFRQAESNVIIDALRAAAGRTRERGRRRTARIETYDPPEQNSPPRHPESTVSELAKRLWMQSCTSNNKTKYFLTIFRQWKQRSMTQKKDRDRVMAEITLSHLLRPANGHGCPVNREAADEAPSPS